MNFSKVTSFLDSLYELFGIPGCDMRVSYHGETVYAHSAGFSDVERTKPVSPDDRYFIYSTSKPLTVVGILHLMEEGKLHLEDEVSKFIPEFAHLTVKDGNTVRPIRGVMTIRHLMTMTSGLSYDLTSPELQKVYRETEGHATTAEIIRALADRPLSFDPGDHYQYSLSHDVLGRIIEVVTGKTFGEAMKEMVFDPLGMNHTGYLLNDENRPFMAAHYVYDSANWKAVPTPIVNEFMVTDRFESGGAGVITTADDYIRFAECLAMGGKAPNGYRLLTMDSIEKLRTPMLNATCLRDFNHASEGYNYGLGVRTMVNPDAHFAKSPVGEFGWNGAAGSYSMMDADNELAIFYVQHIRKCLVTYDHIHPILRDLTYMALGL